MLLLQRCRICPGINSSYSLRNLRAMTVSERVHRETKREYNANHLVNTGVLPLTEEVKEGDYSLPSIVLQLHYPEPTNTTQPHNLSPE